jgi:UDP-N-acetyl-D-mannosaminuronate dehydrogenase
MNLSEAIECADIIVVLVDHNHFKRLALYDLNEKIVINTKGLMLQKALILEKELINA